MLNSRVMRTVHGPINNDPQHLADHGSRIKVPITKARSRSRRHPARYEPSAPDQPQIIDEVIDTEASAPDQFNSNGNANGNANAMEAFFQLHHRLMISREGIRSRSTQNDVDHIRRDVHASPEWHLAIRQSVMLRRRRRAITNEFAQSMTSLFDHLLVSDA